MHILSKLFLVQILWHYIASTFAVHHFRQLNPTSCTTVASDRADDAFAKVSAVAFRLQDEDLDCMVSDQGSQVAGVEPIPVETCVSVDGSTRYFFSNEAIVSTKDQSDADECTLRYGVAMPYAPEYNSAYMEENPVSGPLGFALDGVAFVDAAWAFENGIDTQENENWPYHSSKLPPAGRYPDEDELVGYALDGFPIYGPTDFPLDACNGRLVNGKFRYHMVRMEDVDFSLPQCNEADPRVHNWNPIIGCYRGSTSQSRVFVDDGSRDGMFCSSPDLATCLKGIPGNPVVVIADDDDTYNSAKQCHNSGRSDRKYSPRAIIKVNTVEQVSAAVQCATLSGITVTPRSGAHGFENEACSGELIVDVSGLESLVVNEDTKVVEFGSGHMHGQLYKKLGEKGLVVPGGTENSVGTAGLWLGCGRGNLAHLHGFSCDNVLGIEFVDAVGNIRVADSTANTDMYWMGRGGGGEFPGVVTKFIVQGYDMPSSVWAAKIIFRSDQLPALLKAWVARIEEFSDPVHSMFTNVHSYLGNPILSMTCYSCSDAQLSWMKTQFSEITELAGGGTDYTVWAGSWFDRLLKEDWDEYETLDDLDVKPEWPPVWAVLANGAHMVPSYDASDEMLAVIQNALETYGDGFFLYVYIMSGPHISSVPPTATAYGGREAKYVVHYKFIGGEETEETEVKFPLRDVSMALDATGLPCKGFYNYADREYPCAAESGESWLEAHFSDVPRMRTIKQTEDPHNRFMSEFKAKKWLDDPNDHVFVGWPDVGDWGGTCTCPNGGVYPVGDNSDSCESLACVGGIPGECSSDNPGGAGFKVVCESSGQAPLPSPTAGPTATPSTAESASEPTAMPSTPESTSEPTDMPSTPGSTPEPTAVQSTSEPTNTQTTPGPTSGPTTVRGTPSNPAPSASPVIPTPSRAPVDPPIIITFRTASPSQSNGSSNERLSSLILVVYMALTAMVAWVV
eukprot:CAMPEP_0194049280 /NCGR_PEP_ID=MMETSP0009_2-20130614/30214_1 /TAXON_ID=210454 /ORGANISM="Grammatophora oceanica, Strain CCMP 410" /LENGTH=962 /DNA_ID=CAMNT_0038695391 /DNA_START=115 /DNA_END=3003 /DNA_ORIENTATION=+